MLHECRNNGIQAEAFQTGCDIINQFMTYFDHFFGWFDIFILAIHKQIPEFLKETVYTIDSSVIPLCIQFRWSYEEFIHS